MYISIDVGGTNTRVAVARELKNPIFSEEPLRRKNTHDFEDDLNFIVNAALQLANGEQINAVGIGAPGLPNEDKTELRYAKNISSWVGKPLVASLSKKLSSTVFFDNDVVAAGLGEAYFGSNKGDFDYIIWGTGIGGGTIRYTNLVPLVSVLNWKTYFGDWERDNGGAELAKRFNKAPEEFTDSDWVVVGEDFRNHLIQYLETHKPPAIVFGGGLATRHTETVEQAGRDLGIQIDVTKFGDDSGLKGGFGLIQSRTTSRY